MLPIGENIKKYRNQIGLTQTELATTVGVTQTALAAWERGRNQPDIERVIKLSRALGISVDALCGEKLNSVLTTKADIINAIKLLQSVGATLYFDSPEVDGSPMPWVEMRIQSPKIRNTKDWWLSEFFTKREKLESAVKDELIDEEVLAAWEEKQMHQFSQELLTEVSKDGKH